MTEQDIYIAIDDYIDELIIVASEVPVHPMTRQEVYDSVIVCLDEMVSEAAGYDGKYPLTNEESYAIQALRAHIADGYGAMNELREYMSGDCK